MISPEPIFRIRAELADILHLGATPYGDRRIINILGGWVEGPRLAGRILPGGVADLQGAPGGSAAFGEPRVRRATSAPLAS